MKRIPGTNAYTKTEKKIKKNFTTSCDYQGRETFSSKSTVWWKHRSQTSQCCGPLLRETRLSQSVSGRFADFVVNLWEGFLTAELLSELVIEPSIKHVPKLLSAHVNVSIQHLEPAWNPESISLPAHRKARHEWKASLMEFNWVKH